MKKNFLIFFILILVVLLGWYFYFQVNKESFLSIVNPEFADDKFNYSLKIDGNSGQQMDLIACEIPIDESVMERKVYYYYDINYPLVGSSANSVLGVYEHLLAEYQRKNISNGIIKINSSELASALDDKNGIIIIASGALPDTVYSPNKNLITPWVNKGGTLIWVGDALGYYYGTAGSKITSDDSENKIGWSGQKKILGSNYLEGEYISSVSDTQGEVPSSLTTALGIKFRYTQTGAFLSEIDKNGATDLGYHYNFSSATRTSLSQIKIGKGSFFIFGSPLLNREMEIAWDISQIIVSGFIDADTDMIMFKKISVNKVDSEEIRRKIDIGKNKMVRIIVYSPDFAKSFFVAKDFYRD